MINYFVASLLYYCFRQRNIVVVNDKPSKYLTRNGRSFSEQFKNGKGTSSFGTQHILRIVKKTVFVELLLKNCKQLKYPIFQFSSSWRCEWWEENYWRYFSLGKKYKIRTALCVVIKWRRDLCFVCLWCFWLLLLWSLFYFTKVNCISKLHQVFWYSKEVMNSWTTLNLSKLQGK